MLPQKPPTLRNGPMKKTLLKALVAIDSRENSWLLNEHLQESIDCLLLGIKANSATHGDPTITTARSRIR